MKWEKGKQRVEVTKLSLSSFHTQTPIHTHTRTQAPIHTHIHSQTPLIDLGSIALTITTVRELSGTASTTSILWAPKPYFASQGVLPDFTIHQVERFLVRGWVRRREGFEQERVSEIRH